MSPTPAGATSERAGGAAPYQRHRPEHTLLYQIVQKYYPAFAGLMAEQERPLPDYVQRESPGCRPVGRHHRRVCSNRAYHPPHNTGADPDGPGREALALTGRIRPKSTLLRTISRLGRLGLRSIFPRKQR
jgi:hypothetical protein